jgi:crotonobetainyl-CoA:carnitine CoA-transferase CaiB-like acyl-CoA transferase
MLLAPDKPWPELCALIDLPELANDPRFANNPARMENGAVLCDILGQRIGSLTWQQWRPRFEAWNAPWELIRTIHELGNDPQIAATGAVFPLTLRNGTTVDVVAGPVGFDGKCAPTDPVASPELGEHSDSVLGELGYAPDELKRLRAARVIG